MRRTAQVLPRPLSERRRSAGQKSQPPHYSYASPDYDIFQVICVLRGRLFFESGGVETALAPGMIALLRLGSAFRLHTERVGYEGVYFIATGEDRPSFRGTAKVFAADPETLNLAETMDREIASPGRGSGELLGGLGCALAWRAIRQRAGEARRESGLDWAQTARAALEATLTTGRSAREVLSTLGLSYRQVARHFAGQFGVSPKQYQIAARVREAQRLLEDTRQPVTAIAFELGYPSSQHFAAQFKKETGATPTAWRRKS
jgi:AraC-like DNA-binding protein